jgi:hypothetical protein
MKFVRSQFDINGEDEVLEALPRSMGIDGVDVLQKVKISIALKTEEAVKRLEQETLEKTPAQPSADTLSETLSALILPMT